MRNHRPDMRNDLGPILWGRIGAGDTALCGGPVENGHDARGSFGLVRLEHFPLRSLDSYLAKMYRGDVVVMGKQVSRTYWRTRNRQDEFSMACEVQLKRAKAWHKTHLEKDKALMALHGPPAMPMPRGSKAWCATRCSRNAATGRCARRGRRPPRSKPPNSALIFRRKIVPSVFGLRLVLVLAQAAWGVELALLPRISRRPGRGRTAGSAFPACQNDRATH